MFSHKTFRVARHLPAAAIIALSLGISAQASDVVAGTTPAATVVRYSDLDLSKDAGVRALYARLQRASDRVCNRYEDTRDLRMKRLYDACYQDTLARAVDSVGHAAVKAMFAADDKIRVAGRGRKAHASS